MKITDLFFPHAVVVVVVALTVVVVVVAEKSKPAVVFCMPTAKRNVSYLDQVIKSYNNQGIFQMDGVMLAVLDVDGSTVDARNTTTTIPLHNRITSKCTTTTTVDTGLVPSCQVRQQGLDITSALMQCAKKPLTTTTTTSPGWVVLVEDDCEACNGALVEVLDVLLLLGSMKKKNTIAMVKFSKFVRATAFPVDLVPMYVESVRDRLYDFPYDVTMIEQWAPGRKMHVHTRNLFHHIGHVSTESTRNDDAYRTAYAELRGDKCFEKL